LRQTFLSPCPSNINGPRITVWAIWQGAKAIQKFDIRHKSAESPRKCTRTLENRTCLLSTNAVERYMLAGTMAEAMTVPNACAVRHESVAAAVWSSDPRSALDLCQAYHSRPFLTWSSGACLLPFGTTAVARSCAEPVSVRPLVSLEKSLSALRDWQCSTPALDSCPPQYPSPPLEQSSSRREESQEQWKGSQKTRQYWQRSPSPASSTASPKSGVWRPSQGDRALARSRARERARARAARSRSQSATGRPGSGPLPADLSAAVERFTALVGSPRVVERDPQARTFRDFAGWLSRDCVSRTSAPAWAGLIDAVLAEAGGDGRRLDELQRMCVRAVVGRVVKAGRRECSKIVSTNQRRQAGRDAGPPTLMRVFDTILVLSQMGSCGPSSRA
jgi:hypothetical protein